MTFLLILLFSGWATSYTPYQRLLHHFSPTKLLISPMLPANLSISKITQPSHHRRDRSSHHFILHTPTIFQHPPTSALHPKHSATTPPISTFFIDSPSTSSTLSLSSCPLKPSPIWLISSHHHFSASNWHHRPASPPSSIRFSANTISNNISSPHPVHSHILFVMGCSPRPQTHFQGETLAFYFWSGRSQLCPLVASARGWN